MNIRMPETPSHQPESPDSDTENTFSEFDWSERAELPRSQRRKLGEAALTALDQDEDIPLESSILEDTESTYAEQLQSEITRWRKLYDDDEHSFAQYAKHIHPSTPEEKLRYRNRLLRAEHDASFSWRQMRASTNDAIREGVVSSDRYSIARAEGYGQGIDPTKTIEAASSMFYAERLRALEEAINADTDSTSETKQANHHLLNRTWQVVEKYIESTFDWASSHEGQNIRRSAHNGMIEQLNAMNDLAESYGTPRFTLRNFMKNDFEYSVARDRSGDLNHKAEYDRETVASYFQNVFQRNIAEQRRVQSRRDRLFR